jgi:dihydroorotate dehydrogenase
MNLSSNYLGLHLKHPFMPGASPLVDNLDVVKRLEDAGASAIVMKGCLRNRSRPSVWRRSITWRCMPSRTPRR